MKKILITLLALLAFAVSASPAGAAPVEAEVDYTLALQWWAIPAPPMCASVAIESTTEVPDPTSLDDPAGSTPYASASIPTAYYWPCVITIYEGSWATLTPCLRRAVMRHEVGHLQGLGHSTDPTSIMYPEVQPAVWCPGEEDAVAQATGGAAAQEAADAAAIARGTAIEAENAAAIARLDRAEREEHRRERARCRRTHGKHLKRCWRPAKKA